MLFRSVARILTGAGFEVVTANDGQEGIEMLRKLGSQVALVVSDIEMPRLTGFQFAQAVRQETRFAELPMIAVSSRAKASSRLSVASMDLAKSVSTFIAFLLITNTIRITSDRLGILPKRWY